MLQKAHSGGLLTPFPLSTSQCSQVLCYCTGTVVAQYFWQMQTIHLPYSVLPHKELVIAILLPLLHPMHLVVPCVTAVASLGTAQHLRDLGSLRYYLPGCARL